MDQEITRELMETFAHLTALEVGLRAVILTHSDPAALLEALRVEEEKAHSGMLARPWLDKDIERFQRKVQALRSHIAGQIT